MEHQKVVDEYRNMMEEGRDLTLLESNLYKNDLAVISHIIIDRSGQFLALKDV